MPPNPANRPNPTPAAMHMSIYQQSMNARAWQPMRYITEEGAIFNPWNSPQLGRLSTEVTAALSRFVKNLPGA